MKKTGRDRRVDARGTSRGADRTLRSFDKWMKSLDNIKTTYKSGYSYWAYQRPVLIKNGRKP
jgi:hypothetical protein